MDLPSSRSLYLESKSNGEIDEKGKSNSEELINMVNEGEPTKPVVIEGELTPTMLSIGKGTMTNVVVTSHGTDTSVEESNEALLFPTPLPIDSIENLCNINTAGLLSEYNHTAAVNLLGCSCEESRDFNSLETMDINANPADSADESGGQVGVRWCDATKHRLDYVVSLFALPSFFISSNERDQCVSSSEIGKSKFQQQQRDDGCNLKSNLCDCHHCSVNEKEKTDYGFNKSTYIFDHVSDAFSYSSFFPPVTLRWKCCICSICSGIQQTTKHINLDESLSETDNNYCVSGKGDSPSSYGVLPHYIQFGIKRDRSSCSDNSNLQVGQFNGVSNVSKYYVQNHNHKHNDVIGDDDETDILIGNDKKNSSTKDDRADTTKTISAAYTILKETENGRINIKHNYNNNNINNINNNSTVTTNNANDASYLPLSSNSSPLLQPCCICGTSSCFLANFIERRRREKAVSIEMRQYLRMIEEEFGECVQDGTGVHDRCAVSVDNIIGTAANAYLYNNRCGSTQVKEYGANTAMHTVANDTIDDYTDTDIVGQSLKSGNIGSEKDFGKKKKGGTVRNRSVHTCVVMDKPQDKHDVHRDDILLCDDNGAAGAQLPPALLGTCDVYHNVNEFTHRDIDTVTPLHQDNNRVTIDTGPLLSLSVPAWRSIITTTRNINYTVEQAKETVAREGTVEMHREGEREEDIMMSLVTDYLSHYGYSDTLEAVANDARCKGYSIPIAVVHPVIHKRKKILKLLNYMRNSIISFDTTKSISTTSVDNEEDNHNKGMKRRMNTPWDIMSACHQLGTTEEHSHVISESDRHALSLHLPAVLLLRIWRWWLLILQLKITEERYLCPNRHFDEALILRQMDYDESVLPSPLRLAEIVLYHYSRVPENRESTTVNMHSTISKETHISEKYISNGRRKRGVGNKETLSLAVPSLQRNGHEEALLFLYVQCLAILSCFRKRASGIDDCYSNDNVLPNGNKDGNTQYQRDHSNSLPRRFWQSGTTSSQTYTPYTASKTKTSQGKEHTVYGVNVPLSNPTTITASVAEFPPVPPRTSTENRAILATVLDFQKEQEMLEYHALREELNDYLKSRPQQPQKAINNHNKSDAYYTNKRDSGVPITSGKGPNGINSTSWSRRQIHDYNRRSILEDVGVWAEYEASVVPKYKQYT